MRHSYFKGTHLEKIYSEKKEVFHKQLLQAGNQNQQQVMKHPCKENTENTSSGKKMFFEMPEEFTQRGDLVQFFKIPFTVGKQLVKGQTLSEDANLGKRFALGNNLVIPTPTRINNSEIKPFNSGFKSPKNVQTKSEVIENDEESDSDINQPLNQVIKASRSSKGYTILAEDRLTEKVPKKTEHLEMVDHILKVLKHFYTCRPWKERPQDSFEAVGKCPWFLKYIGNAIFNSRELTLDNYIDTFEKSPPKSKRKDELQKKVLSKARWEATRTMIKYPKEEIELRVLARDYALKDCNTMEDRVTAIRSIRRIFGNIEKTCSYEEAYMEIQSLILEKQAVTEPRRQELLRELKELFCSQRNACDLPKDIKSNLVSAAKSKEMEELIGKAIHNMGSLVKEGLHNEAARAMITNQVIVDNMLNHKFLNRVLAALDEQTVNDIQTNYISKLKAAYYDLENGAKEEVVEDYLKRCFNTTKFSKHPLTHIQNAMAMVDYLHKLNYRAKSERSDRCPPPREHLKSLKQFYEKEHNRRCNVKEGRESDEKKPELS